MDFKEKKYVFFDFDGTIIDTGPGIKNGVRYALGQLGIPVREGDTLDGFIGPPMTQSYPNNYGLDAETTKEAIRIFGTLFMGDLIPGSGIDLGPIGILPISLLRWLV